MRVAGIAVASLLAAAVPNGTNQDRPFQWVNRMPETAHPGLHHRTFPSPSMGVEVGYVVYLPPGYREPSQAERRYPVVYWLPGGRSGNEVAGLALADEWDRQIRSGRIGPRLYVIVNGGPLNYYDHGDSRGETAFIRELIPHVDRTYRTLANRSGRALEGFSAGGRGTARLLFRYPELFGSGAALSGGHQYEKEASQNGGKVALGSQSFRLADPGNNTWDLARAYAARDGAPGVEILVAVGAADRNYAANLEWMAHLQALGLPFTRRVVAGVPHRALQLYEQIGPAIMGFQEEGFAGPEPARSIRRSGAGRRPSLSPKR